jgi:hypothetical protein
MLQKYDLHVFEICDNAEKLSKQLARQWLKKYMFAGDRSASARVNKIVHYFATHDKHLSHVRGVGIDECIKQGLRIHDLRQDHGFGALIWELWQRIEFFFGAHPAAAKLFENSRGVSFVRMFPQQMALQLGSPLPFVFPQPAPQQPDQPK